MYLCLVYCDCITTMFIQFSLWKIIPIDHVLACIFIIKIPISCPWIIIIIISFFVCYCCSSLTLSLPLLVPETPFPITFRNIFCVIYLYQQKLSNDHGHHYYHCYIMCICVYVSLFKYECDCEWFTNNKDILNVLGIHIFYYTNQFPNAH